MSGSSRRGGAAVIDDIYLLTVEMTCQLEDAEFLLEHIESRQALMDEIDRLRAEPEPLYASQQEKELSEGFIAQIIEMDRAVLNALEKHRDEAKANLAASKSTNRVLGYTNSAIAGSGSYMDYKK